MSTTVPATVWRPTDGGSEASNPGVSDLVDAAGVFLADSSGNLLADNGSILTQLPATVWAEDNSQ